MHRVAPVIAQSADCRAPAQVISAHAEILGDTGDVFIRRINDLAAEDPGQCGLRHASASVKLRGGDPVAVQQLS